jgi:hypothetical protein
MMATTGTIKTGLIAPMIPATLILIQKNRSQRFIQRKSGENLDDGNVINRWLLVTLVQ